MTRSTNDRSVENEASREWRRGVSWLRTKEEKGVVGWIAGSARIRDTNGKTARGASSPANPAMERREEEERGRESELKIWTKLV